jgi:DNA-binding transcriptional MerR regulator
MFTIGDFARLGRVSVRMLRHYDALGLLTPAEVDPDSAYRRYSVDQLPRLNRLIALKDLGFKLEQVRAILDESVDAEELAGMLRLRRAELEAQITGDTKRLARVEARLRAIQEEGQMITQEVTLKSVPAIRVAELQGTAGSWAPEDISPEIRSLFGELGERLSAAGVTPCGDPIAHYEPRDDDSITVSAAVPVDLEPGEHDGFTVRDLPPIEQAATLLHYGAMNGVVPSYEALSLWAQENGLRTVGLSREVTLECPADEDSWVTELQMVVADR